MYEKRSDVMVFAKIAAALLGLSLSVAAQPVPADIILSNGKIVTVDERFTIAQAVAIRADRIVAVGSNQDIARLAGPATRRIDLRGREVLPGFIDNHMHLLRFGTTWKYEVRLDGVESRKEALARIRDRAKTLKAGEWIYTLGGWAMEQFADDPKPFTREELDAAAPANPVLLQASYFEAYLNSLALTKLGVDQNPNVRGVVLDSTGKPTGRIAEEGFRALVDKLPLASDQEIEASSRGMIRELNTAGLTSIGAVGCDEDLLNRYKGWAAHGELNVRVYCIVTPQGGRNIDQFIANIGTYKVFDGDDYINHIAFGENFGGMSDPMFEYRPQTKPQDVADWRRIITEVAKQRFPLHVHVNFEETIDTYLDQMEAVNKEYPIRNLRWMMAHLNQPTAAQLERMKKLGVYAAVHPWAVINGGINLRQFGDAAYSMAPLATIQRSGITWGFGSDGSRANQTKPFETLAWAVTGKMVGGKRF